MTKITLQQIRDHSPCTSGWKKLLQSLDNPSDMSIQVSIGQIARSNDTSDALWCFRCADFDRRDVIRCILPSVKRASVYTTDKRVLECIDAIEKWLVGDNSIDLSAAANAAAYAAAYATAYAARAAYAAADAAAYAAAYAANAADAAAYAAANAADAAANAAAYAAYAAANADDAAADAADAAERNLQIEDICAVFP